ncbi:hypothetical protein [Variovorax ginsengisoli]|uniref:Integrase n=1 Tax=Variovorax ginsengisoli TaxID=363844 RepID=A0ABT8SIU0_9BURK|nr:hypothetical protein [Variovorax ginsengisoli]MDN8618912.1 hypothetical protein [Variovorax ginsengisoli]MDO1538082.1 hypothetical protein [Variovorax ginsengisoli]
MTSYSLFDETPSEGHRLAFERWLDGQRASGSLRQPASVEVYRDMWGAFTAWCLGQSPAVTLASLSRVAGYSPVVVVQISPPG